MKKLMAFLFRLRDCYNLSVAIFFQRIYQNIFTPYETVYWLGNELNPPRSTIQFALIAQCAERYNFINIFAFAFASSLSPASKMHAFLYCLLHKCVCQCMTWGIATNSLNCHKTFFSSHVCEATALLPSHHSVQPSGAHCSYYCALTGSSFCWVMVLFDIRLWK